MYKNELDPRDNTYLYAVWHRLRMMAIIVIALIPLNVLGAGVSGPGAVTLSPGQKWESVDYTLSTSFTNTNYISSIYTGYVRGSRFMITSMASSSDGRYYGYQIAKDVIMYWEGTVVADGLIANGAMTVPIIDDTQSHLAIKYASGHESITRNECNMVSWAGAAPCIAKIGTVYGWDLDTDPKLTYVRSMEYRLNLKFGVYVGPNAATGTYSVPELSFVLDSSNRYLMMKAGTVEVIPPLECNIDIPPKIEFLKVNIWDLEGNIPGTPGGKLGDVLGVVEGNFAINCTGDRNSRASATLTLNGTSGNLSEDLILTMDRTGEVAPASVRVTIKDLKPPCSSGVSWGPVAGNPNANVVKLDDLVPGNKQVPYRFSLCSTGQGFKGGAASGSATIKFDWE